jgi:hypothetical protein
MKKDRSQVIIKEGQFRVKKTILQWSKLTVFLMIWKRDRDRCVHYRPHKNDRQ